MSLHICDDPQICYQNELKSIGMIVGNEIITKVKIISCKKINKNGKGKDWYELELKKKYKKIKEVVQCEGCTLWRQRTNTPFCEQCNREGVTEKRG